MENKPDDRRDNVDRIQHNINNNIENIGHAEEMIEKTDEEKNLLMLWEQKLKMRQ